MDSASVNLDIVWKTTTQTNPHVFDLYLVVFDVKFEETLAELP